MPAHRGTELVKETMQRSPLFQEDLDFPLLFHFAPGADYEGAVPLMTRWHIKLYYQEPLWFLILLSAKGTRAVPDKQKA